MKKDNSRKIYGVIGFPAKHSLSPLMHNAAFHALKINAEYKIFEKTPEELAVFLNSLTQEGIAGLNVTVPYKEKVISFLTKLSREAKLIGAVNTIKVSGAKLEGFNTDAEGILAHLKKELKFNPKNKKIALIGAGGAAKAVCVALAKEKPKSITLYDIDRIKAESLLCQLKENFAKIDFNLADTIEGLAISSADLLINATPIGMKEEDPLLVPEGLLQRNLLVYDLVYNPDKTKLLQAAERIGAKFTNGLGMLLYQGAASFKIWTAKKAPLKIMRDALEEGVKKL